MAEEAKPDERRANPNPLDIAGALAVLYTLGYLASVALLYFVDIPVDNKEPLLQVLGLMSAIQMALIGFYYGGSKTVEATQRATEQRQGRAAAVVEEIAKAAPAATVAAVAAATGNPAPPTEPQVTPAPPLPDGTVPAKTAEQITNEPKKDPNA